MSQEAEGSSGIPNWFLSSFHRRAKLGGLYLNHIGGNQRTGPRKSERTGIRFVSRRWRRKCIFWVMEGGGIPQRRFQLAAWDGGVSWHVSSTSGLPKWALNPQAGWEHGCDLSWTFMWLLQTLAYPRVFNCERSIRRGKKRRRDEWMKGKEGREWWMNEAEKQAGNLKGFRRMRNVLSQPSGRKEKKQKENKQKNPNPRNQSRRSSVESFT